MLTLEATVGMIDWDRVAEQIRQVPEGTRALIEYDYENVAEMVWKATEKWLKDDLNDFLIEAVEEKMVMPVELFPGDPNTVEGVSFICDVRGRILSTMPKWLSVTGKGYVLDWKTTTTLDARWQEKRVRSWQHRIYCAATGAEVAIYRGVNRKLETRELILPVPREKNHQEVMNYLVANGRQRAVLIDGGFAVWPMNRPGGCGAYGRVCRFKSQCDRGEQPKGVPEHHHISYSALENFFTCPERCRRIMLGERDQDDAVEADLGSAFHRGVAEVWRQAAARG